ncbi:MAG: glycosyltransferase family 87 protein [Gaiellaceae bacterium]
MSVVSARQPRLVAGWRSFEAWIGTRSSAAALFGAALAVYAVQSAFLPTYPGRDMSRYLEAFVQLAYHVPMYPAVLNTRGPLSALGVGLPLELGGWAAEVFLALLYALSIVAWGRVALTFGRRAALATSALLLVFPGYGILFHQLASDSLFAAVFAGWALLVAEAVLRPSLRRFLLVGVGLGVLVLVRPANQVLLVMSLLPLVVRAPWRERLTWAAACFVPAVVVAQSWRVFAELRWGDAVALEPSTGLLALALLVTPLLLPRPWRMRAAVALLVGAVVVLAVHGWPGKSPADYARGVTQNESNQFLYRSFELERIMSPSNGPASRRVAQTVRRTLLTREPYRSYEVDVDEFFSSGSDRVFGDMTGVVPAADLAGATREAIREHPGAFAGGIGRTIWKQIAQRPVYAPEPSKEEAAAPPPASSGKLPPPTEGQPIPGSAIGPALWTIGGPAQEVWRSATEHSFVFTDPRDARRFAKFNRSVDRLSARIPTREGNATLIHRFNQASHAFPPLVVWLLVGLVAMLLRRPRGALVALAPCVAGLIVIVATSLVAPSVAEYSAPVSPAFVLLAAAGLLGAPSPARRQARSLPGARYAGAAAGAVAALWTLAIYFDRLHKYADGAGAQHDLAVFLRGAADVVHGSSPYVFRGDSTFAYPPLAAWLLAPLHPLGSSAAAIVWTLLSLAMVGVALWLLELRDWRCYALVGVFLFTRSSIDLGTIEPLLLLAVAAAWRWRDRAVPAGAAAGVAIVLKLFLWPLAVWLALTRRTRAAVVAVAAAVALAVVSWATIGFAGIGDYPSVLRRLADDESTSSYSVVALGVRAHLPLLGARILSVLVALALLAAAAWTARDEGRSARERDVATLTLCLAAALALSPIVWVHYFLLLLVPLALARPRLSWLWFVPLAYYPLGEAAWPAGDARKLGLALVASLVLLLAGVVRTQTLRGLRA